MELLLFTPHDLLKALTVTPYSDAELRLSIGMAVRSCLRREISLPSIASSAQTTVEECLLSLRFAEASAGLKFQALVEDWPWSRITAALAAKESEDARCKLANAQDADHFPQSA